MSDEFDILVDQIVTLKEKLKKTNKRLRHARLYKQRDVDMEEEKIPISNDHDYDLQSISPIN